VLRERKRKSSCKSRKGGKRLKFNQKNIPVKGEKKRFLSSNVVK
jgi:hypothetical protein